MANFRLYLILTTASYTNSPVPQVILDKRGPYLVDNPDYDPENPEEFPAKIPGHPTHKQLNEYLGCPGGRPHEFTANGTSYTAFGMVALDGRELKAIQDDALVHNVDLPDLIYDEAQVRALLAQYPPEEEI